MIGGNSYGGLENLSFNKKDNEDLEHVQTRAKKMEKGLDHKSNENG